MFGAVRVRCPETAELIERLEKQHAERARLINELDTAHKTFDAGFPAGLEELRAVVHAYVDFQREHIALEERELIPAARNHLSPRIGAQSTVRLVRTAIRCSTRK